MPDRELTPGMKALEKNEKAQLRRFCLYGFLKNQLYFEPFLILAFREKGFSFTAIGALIAFRAVSVNLLEIPSGAAADAWGRRRSMIVSMAGYIISFIIFALATDYRLFFPAMFAFAVGEAFRTGTHKAMIFDWLGRLGLQDEKTRIYGLTRSWSKIGSSINAVIAAAIVIVAQSYVWIFWFSIIPYALNIINFMFYPGYLNAGPVGDAPGPRRRRPFPAALTMLKDGLALCARRKKLRSLILENVCFEGFYSAAKDYLQPLLKAAALAAPVLLSKSDMVRTAVLVGATYAALNLLSSVASRKSHRAAAWAGGESRLTGRIWLMSLGVYAAAAAGIAVGTSIAAILAFVLLAVMLNIWKPVFVSRFYESAESETAATTLSVSNQSKTLSIALLAPLLGMAVDYAAVHGSALFKLWPVAVCGMVFSFAGLMLQKQRCT